ncbi:cobalt ECF transporter T component CbiQ [Phaeovulum vinaykumarii]|uniref:Cobalt/nickel transport system permease protein n=1 Tax=Phaeovulum vinaykumarii TaxID=407234 RepID=A0A1N7MEZ4_9RHOB|nr:cobalt ECF transporter T component CbiQ [Phaeovulum vinaykumarii]SIS84628.1 cobalt/nickel transport system permease protein [Phaeovulum vinaykumarii]SOC11865.1 cobalt/nickel transport system permease protein [Phaeovulum vinaykumarii]
MTLPPLLPCDLRARLIAGVAVLLLIAPLAHLGPALAALAGVLALIVLRRQPIPWRRLWHLEAFLILLLVTLPFSVPGTPILELGPLSASREGVLRAGVVAAKVAASVLFLTLLFAGVEPARLGTTLRALHVPEALVRVFLGLVRYLGLIRAEMQRLQDAMRARAFRPRSNLHTWRVYGYLLGMMLLRALARAQRAEDAMRLRGYTGRFLHDTPSPLTAPDRIAALALPLLAAANLGWDLIAKGAGSA